MIASAVIAAVSQDLNDQEPGYEYTTWSYDMLQRYLQEAVIQLSSYFRKYFVTQKVVQVESGGDWQSVCDCESIIKILGESTSDGQHIIRRLRYLREEAESRLIWNGGKVACSGHSDNYAMTGYVINDADDSLFRVVPPVPIGSTPHYVKVECVSTPHVTDDYDVPQRLLPMVKQWMLMRAYAVDSENNPVVVQLSETHRQTFFRLLELGIAALAKEEVERDSLRVVQNSPAQ